MSTILCRRTPFLGTGCATRSPHTKSWRRPLASCRPHRERPSRKCPPRPPHSGARRRRSTNPPRLGGRPCPRTTQRTRRGHKARWHKAGPPRPRRSPAGGQTQHKRGPPCPESAARRWHKARRHKAGPPCPRGRPAGGQVQHKRGPPCPESTEKRRHWSSRHKAGPPGPALCLLALCPKRSPAGGRRLRQARHKWWPPCPRSPPRPPCLRTHWRRRWLCPGRVFGWVPGVLGFSGWGGPAPRPRPTPPPLGPSHLCQPAARRVAGPTAQPPRARRADDPPGQKDLETVGGGRVGHPRPPGGPLPNPALPSPGPGNGRAGSPGPGRGGGRAHCQPAARRAAGPKTQPPQARRADDPSGQQALEAVGGGRGGNLHPPGGPLPTSAPPPPGPGNGRAGPTGPGRGGGRAPENKRGQRPEQHPPLGTTMQPVAERKTSLGSLGRGTRISHPADARRRTMPIPRPCRGHGAVTPQPQAGSRPVRPSALAYPMPVGHRSHAARRVCAADGR
jgi:hypothetical protein